MKRRPMERKFPPDLEEALAQLDPKLATRIRNMSQTQLKQEEHRLVHKMAGLNQERDKLEAQIKSNQMLIGVLEGRIVITDTQHRTEGRK